MIMHYNKKYQRIAFLVIVASVLAGPMARADVVTDWNIKAGEIIVEARLGPPPAYRVLAIVHTAVFEAVNAITKRYPASGFTHPTTKMATEADLTAEADFTALTQRYPASGFTLAAAPGASVEAAVAAASHATLAKCVPSQQAAIDTAYHTALALIADGPAKLAGLAVGEKAAAVILASRLDDGAATAETYRPHTTAGVYVPTVIPAAPQWPQRKAWLMTSSAQFRPGPPPALTSAVWARDYNEIKALGAKHSTRRTAEQTEIARFWEATLPPIYHGLVRSLATLPGREVTQNARLLMAVTQATDDALIAVLDAKYHYHFWRPVTAIRNGDIDGNDATEREPSWTPFIDTPMHPEYPCAHCIVSGAVGTVLQAEIGPGPMPTLTTTSVTAKGAARSWTTIDAFMQEVAEARIYDGVHYRTSTEVGTAMGKQIGELAVAKYLRTIK
jgi:hypothetical protein